jgi:hypothetical protein
VDTRAARRALAGLEEAVVLFKTVDIADIDWAALDQYADRTCSQRKSWIDYLIRIGAGTPVFARLEDGGKEMGWFTGMRRRYYGVPVLGSPLPGWNTAFMGLNLVPGVPRKDALVALSRYAFLSQKCVYVEISDVVTDTDSARAAGFVTAPSTGYVSDLSLSEDELLARMTSACRRCIKKATREGVIVEEASPEGFAAEFHEQLTNVFAHQGRGPTYSRERVEALVDCVYPSGDLLLLRARTREGQSIATAVFCGFGYYSSFWGNGSIRDMLHLRPNQVIHWYAMRYWKARGVRYHAWGGGGSYKESYGPEPLQYLRSYKGAVPGLAQIRQPAAKLYYWLRAKRLGLKSSSGDHSVTGRVPGRGVEAVAEVDPGRGGRASRS